MKIFLAALLTFIYNDIVTHVPIHGFRKLFLRLFNKKIARTARIMMHVRFLGFWNVEIGERSVINQYCLLDGRKSSVQIKHDVDVGPYTRIWTTGHNPDSPTHDIYYKDVVLEDHAWIASGATILPGVTIGAGAVVAAQSVVTKNVDALSIVGGNPAQFIRKRNNPLQYRLNYKPYFE